jgi:cyanophycin synthetase
MFPPGNDGRIPVVAVVGDATGAATKHLTALLASAGLRAGSTGAAGICVGGRRWDPQAGTPQERAAVLMQNTTVDVALLETSPRELVRAAFGNDRCDVALLLQPEAAEGGSDPDAQGDDISPAEAGDFRPALRHALAPGGAFVLPAGADPGLPAANVVLIAYEGGPSGVRRHLAAGGRALLAQGDVLAMAQGAETPTVLGKCPGTLPEREMQGLLAALAAGLALGHSAATLTAFLRGLAADH